MVAMGWLATLAALGWPATPGCHGLVVILGNQRALSLSTTLRFAHWSSITTSPSPPNLNSSLYFEYVSKKYSSIGIV